MSEKISGGKFRKRSRDSAPNAIPSDWQSTVWRGQKPMGKKFRKGVNGLPVTMRNYNYGQSIPPQPWRGHLSPNNPRALFSSRKRYKARTFGNFRVLPKGPLNYGAYWKDKYPIREIPAPPPMGVIPDAHADSFYWGDMYTPGRGYAPGNDPEQLMRYMAMNNGRLPGNPGPGMGPAAMGPGPGVAPGPPPALPGPAPPGPGPAAPDEMVIDPAGDAEDEALRQRLADLGRPPKYDFGVATSTPSVYPTLQPTAAIPALQPSDIATNTSPYDIYDPSGWEYDAKPWTLPIPSSVKRFGKWYIDSWKPTEYAADIATDSAFDEPKKPKPMSQQLPSYEIKDNPPTGEPSAFQKLFSSAKPKLETAKAYTKAYAKHYLWDMWWQIAKDFKTEAAARKEYLATPFFVEQQPDGSWVEYINEEYNGSPATSSRTRAVNRGNQRGLPHSGLPYRQVIPVALYEPSAQSVSASETAALPWVERFEQKEAERKRASQPSYWSRVSNFFANSVNSPAQASIAVPESESQAEADSADEDVGARSKPKRNRFAASRSDKIMLEQGKVWKKKSGSKGFNNSYGSKRRKASSLDGEGFRGLTVSPGYSTGISDKPVADSDHYILYMSSDLDRRSTQDAGRGGPGFTPPPLPVNAPTFADRIIPGVTPQMFNLKTGDFTPQNPRG